MAQRSCRLDNVKGLLMLLVVFAHLLELFSGPGRLWLYETIYLFHMPAFVYCSGYFARFSWKKVGKSLLPYALFQTLYVLFVLALGGRHAHPLTTPYWLMWYLFSMVLWTLCLPLAERCGPRLSLLLSAAAALAVGYVTGVGYPFSLSRTIVLLLALVNQVLSMLGIPVLPIEDEAINTVVSTLWTIIAAVVAWWKNNSFTTAALEADQVLAEKRKEQ